MEYELTHTCEGIKKEKQRLYDNGFDADIIISMLDSDSSWEVSVMLYDRMGEDGELVRAEMLDIVYCPYCGMRLPKV